MSLTQRRTPSPAGAPSSRPLADVLESDLQRWSQDTGIRGIFYSHLRGHERVPTDVEALLRDILAEVLATYLTGRYSQTIDVLLERRDNHVLLFVANDDESHGHAPLLTSAGDRFQDRLAALDGRFEIEAIERSGATAIVRIPAHPGGVEPVSASRLS